jgi:AraC-like DNA-binding protein
LASEVICDRFACSRATLYRLFESESGLVNYILRRRLQHALMELISPNSPRRIIDIAMDNHFSGEATFSRAFRREFDIPPGEARRLAQLRPAPDIGLASRASGDPGPLAIRWIRQLSPFVRPADR